MLRDLTDSEARAALPLKWGAVPEGTIPAWVAEMDFAPPPAVTAALTAELSDFIHSAWLCVVWCPIQTGYCWPLSGVARAVNCIASCRPRRRCTCLVRWVVSVKSL